MDSGSRAGNDTITAGAGANLVAGEAQAISDGIATATGENKADDGATAGNDTITSGDDNDTISGGAQSKGVTSATATQTNTASDGGSTDRKSTRLNSSH